ncbi:MAG: DoxX family protein [Chloroflexota bacterium]|nr:DoxX family protein [Chloroflexota bacterium]
MVLAHLGYFAGSLVAIVFVAAGVMKLSDRRSFVRALHRYALLPRWAVTPAASALPPMEIAIGVAVVVGWFAPLPLIAAACLLVVFGLAIGVNLARGRPVPCGCFGGRDDPPANTATIWRNLGLAAVAVAAVVLQEAASRSVVVATPAEAGILVLAAVSIVVGAMTVRTLRDVERAL